MEVAPPAGATIGILCFSVTSATASMMGELIRTEHQIHLVLRDELFIEADGRGGVRPVVVDDQLELPPQHPALVVQVLDAELVAAELVLADRRIRAGLGERRADPDRRLRLSDERRGEEGEAVMNTAKRGRLTPRGYDGGRQTARSGDRAKRGASLARPI